MTFSEWDWVSAWGDDREKGRIISFLKDKSAKVLFFTGTPDNIERVFSLDELLPYIKIIW